MDFAPSPLSLSLQARLQRFMDDLVLPSMAVRVPSVASCTMRAATCAASCSTEPASFRDTRVPAGV